MALTIKVIHYKENSLEPPLTAIFDEKGGTLGRSTDNHLVLADDEKVVSSIHAVIEYQNGCYYYVDNSLNGTQLISRNQLVHHKKIQLHNQDRLRIGAYDLLIDITKKDSETLNTLYPYVKSVLPKQPLLQEDSPFSLFDQDNGKKHIDSKEPDVIENDNFFDSLDNFIDSLEKEEFTGYPKSVSSTNSEYNDATDECLTPPVSKEHSKGNLELPEDLTLEDFFSDEEQKPEAAADARGANNASSPGHDSFVKSDVNAKEKKPVNSIGSSCPEDSSDPVHSPRLERSFSVASTFDQWLHIFFKAAEMDNVDDFPESEISELMQSLGTILKESIDGLMKVLRGRTELKSQLRVVMTTFKESENNPLKFSPTAEMVLKTFLIDRNPAFLDAANAIREGFEDIKNHETAISAGIQVSLLHTLKRFDPDQFEKKFNERYIMNKNARCWKEYKQAYQQLIEEALDGFFGKEFVRAYEEQIKKFRPVKNG
jgi:type VI secretion system protein ImpI/type VI secretion system protein